MKKSLCAVLVVFIVTLCFPLQILAAGTVDASIPVRCEAKGSQESFQYILMKDGVQVTAITLKDGQEDTLLLTFDMPGTYVYRVKQVPGKDSNTEYCKKEYIVQVYVTESDEGVLSCEVIAYMEGSQEKTDKLFFQNIVTKESEEKENTKTTSQTKSNTSPQTVTSTTEQVKTGDASQLIPYIGMLLFAVLVIYAASRKKEAICEEK